MPKTSLKQKNHERNSNNINSKLNSKVDISGINVLTDDIKPPFPPTLTINDLIKNALKSSTNNKPRTIPNAFIVYRMALINEYYIKSCKLPPMGEFSKIAKNSWNKEPKHVKDVYESLVREAKSVYKQNKIQFVLDKHMNGNTKVESGQTLLQRQSHTITHEMDKCMEISSNNLIQDSVVSVMNSSHNNDVSLSSTSCINISLINSSPDYDFFESPYELNFTLNHQGEYIRVLEQENRIMEQVIDYFLGN